VNGGLFSGSTEVPRFSKIARSYLLHIANLDWKKINPDIFGSMIQAVADDEERRALGMHYTSVPNILKVLNPLFLDNLRGVVAQLDRRPSVPLSPGVHATRVISALPRAEKRFIRAMRVWISAAWRSGSREAMRSPKLLRRRIWASIRLRA
jgi:hypothetical protein